MSTMQHTEIIKKKFKKFKKFKKNKNKGKKKGKKKMEEHSLNGKYILSKCFEFDTFKLFMDFHAGEVTDSQLGFIFEAMCILIGSVGLFDNTEISLQNFNSYPNIKPLDNINDFMKKTIQNHDGPSDVTLRIAGRWVPFTIKYRDNCSPKECEMDQLDTKLAENGDVEEKRLFAVIVKHTDDFKNHTFQHDGNIHKKLRDRVVSNDMIFGIDDIAIKYLKMKEIFKNCTLDSAINLINKVYLNAPYQHLKKRLHQRLFELQFERNFEAGQFRHLLQHKCRAGKSISILLVVKHLMKKYQKKRILITTGVGATIDDYINTIEKFHIFKDMKYYRQKDFSNIEDKSKPFILFTSNQYLKVPSAEFDKTTQLNKMNFDVMAFDESHQGGSTLKTHENIISQIKTDSKLVIYASATGRRTKNFYSIPESCVYRWSLFDEAQMKKTTTDTDLMIRRHGEDFAIVAADKSLDGDYSKCPIQIQIRPSLDEKLIPLMNQYNIDNEQYTNGYGFEFHRLFDLQKTKKSYKKKFAICTTTTGEEMFKKCLELIISSNPMSNSIMDDVERTQSGYNSRKSTRENPQLFLMYLPIKTHGPIGLLMETLVQFLDKNKLWKDYQIEYNCGTANSSPCKQSYNEFISSCMMRTKTNNKKGCILLLGNKGNTGITYPECDVTISLDNGSSLDRKQQADSRSLNPAPGKTISLNIDLNQQRTMRMINDRINKFKTLSDCGRKTSEILRYFFENKIFLVNPQEINFGTIHVSEINKYCEKLSDQLRPFIEDDAFLLDSIECEDDLESYLKMKEIQSIYSINKDLEGIQPTCPKVGQNKILLDIIEKTITQEEEELVRTDVENFIKQNKTKQLLKRVVPLLGLLHRTNHDINTLEDIWSSKYKKLLGNVIESQVKNKSILSSDYIINILHKTIMNNKDIIEQIKELYLSSDPGKIRKLVEKHFTPSQEEKIVRAEIPSPVVLIDEMMSNEIWANLNGITKKFWTQPRKCLESCCGKGNFVLAIFDKFMKELPSTLDVSQKCKTIIEECLIFGDITPMNVFITQELLKCHAYSYCKKDETYKFNSFVGNSLEMSLQEEFGFENVDLVIGNPPYNSSGAVGSGNTIWQEFVKKSLNSWLKDDGLLCFVHPPPWRKPNSIRGRFNGLFQMMSHENRMLFLSMNGLETGKKVFNCGTRFDWYIIQRGAGNVSTLISDDDDKDYTLNLKKVDWLPNSMLSEVKMLMGNNDEERCKVIYSASAYEHRKPHMRHDPGDDFIYKCVHSTPKSGTRYMWSNRCDKGMFGVSKIIFGEAGLNYVIIDTEGEYGLTNGAIGIEIDSREEGELYKKFLESDKFKAILKACSFSNYRVDRCVFNSFKKQFYNSFADFPAAE
jgi:hypothetical protein